MLASQIPTKFPIPFGNNADPGLIRSVPTADQSSVTPGAASLTKGFPTINGQPLAGGGIPPSIQDFNGLFNQITAWNRWQNAGGMVAFDAAFSTAIGGYPNGAVLKSTTPGMLWLSIVDNNLTDPDSGSAAGWVGIATTNKAAATSVAQAAGSPFNSQPYQITARTALTGNQAGVPSTAFSGLVYQKQSALSRLIVEGKFQTRSNSAPGNGNGAQYFLLNVGSGLVRLALNNGYPGYSANNSLWGTIYSLPAGNLSISGVMQREDNLQWFTTFLPTSADESGYPPINVFDMTIHEEP